MSPNARTLAELRRLGCLAQGVQRYIRQAKISVDLWGFADYIAMTPENKLLLVQATDMAHHAERIKKIFGLRWNTETHKFLEQFTPFREGIVNPAEEWLKCGGAIEVWGWRKLIRGERKGGRWRVERTEIRLDSFEDGMTVLKLNVEDRIAVSKETAVA